MVDSMMMLVDNEVLYIGRMKVVDLKEKFFDKIYFVIVVVYTWKEIGRC
jgi:hypothetical protein